MIDIITKIKTYILKKQIKFMIDHQHIYEFLKYLFNPFLTIKKILFLLLYKILEFLYNKTTKENISNPTIDTFFIINQIGLYKLYKFEPFGYKTKYSLFIIDKKIKYFIKTDKELNEIITILRTQEWNSYYNFIKEILYVPYISHINGPLLLCLLLLILDYAIDNLLKAFIISLIIKLVL